MFRVHITASLTSNSNLDNIKDRVTAALTALASLHEHDDPTLQIAVVTIEEQVVTMEPVMEAGFYTDTLTLR